MGQVDGQWHQGGGLSACVPEHQALIPGPLFLVKSCPLGDALGDVRTLLIDGDHDRTVLMVEADVRIDVSNALDRLTDDRGDIYVGLCRNLTGNDGHSGRHQCLTRDAAIGVLSDHCVQNAVGNLIGHLVRMSLRHRFAGEQVVLRTAATTA